MAQGYDVVMSNSRGPESLSELVTELGPHARAATPAEAAAAADLAVVTVPLRAIDSVPVEPLAGKVVIDIDNYYPQRDDWVLVERSPQMVSNVILPRLSKVLTGRDPGGGISQHYGWTGGGTVSLYRAKPAKGRSGAVKVPSQFLGVRLSLARRRRLQPDVSPEILRGGRGGAARLRYAVDPSIG